MKLKKKIFQFLIYIVDPDFLFPVFLRLIENRYRDFYLLIYW